MLADLLDDSWRAGVEQGQAQDQREIALNMLKDELSIDRIRKYTKLSGDEIPAFQKNGEQSFATENCACTIFQCKSFGEE
ncbi:MAG: hypothetical protein ACR2PY_01820 [Salinispira sp.]